MSYSVKEIFYSIQGEGANLGRPAVFCRFTGCNIWNGQEKNRAQSICSFCDTDFVGTDGTNGGAYSSEILLAKEIDSVWRKNLEHSDSSATRPLLIFTGGEPTLQLDEALIAEVKKLGFKVAIETNGTNDVPKGVDWITVSPKDLSKLKQKSGNELKLLFPFTITPEDVSELNFERFYLSPICETSPEKSQQNTELALRYCLENPKWSLTLQYHKILNVP
jgi:7-carboxy-7-deazaguanine synthase (Cx14CxxC type)